MPRQQTLQIEGHQAVEGRGLTVGTQVVAHPVDTMVDQGTDQKMAQLNHFLQAGNDLVGTVVDTETKLGAQDRALGREQPKSMLGLREKGWLSMDAQVKQEQDAADMFGRASTTGILQKPGPELEKFISEETKLHMEGMRDGPFKASYEAGLAKSFDKLRQAHAQTQVRELENTALTNTTQLLTAELAKASQPGAERKPGFFTNFQARLKEMGQGISSDLYGTVVKAVIGNAAQQGDTRFLDILKESDENGQSLYNEPHIRDWADDQYTKADHFKQQKREKDEREYLASLGPWRFDQMRGLDGRVENGERVPDKEIRTLIGKGNVFETEEAALAFVHKMDEGLKSKRELELNLDKVFQRNASDLDPADQKKAQDALVGDGKDGTPGIRTQFFQAFQKGDPNAKALWDKWVGIIHGSGFSIPDAGMVRFFASISSAAPSTDPQARARFDTAAALYKALPPNLRNQMVKEDSLDILDKYNRFRDTMPTEEAYDAAYRSVDPAVKQQVALRNKDPDTKAATMAGAEAHIKGRLTGLLTGWMGFDKRPDNAQAMTDWAQGLVEEAVAAGNGTNEDIEAYVEKKTKQRWGMDNENKVAYLFPAGQNTQENVKAIAWKLDQLRGLPENKDKKLVAQTLGDGKFLFRDVTDHPNGPVLSQGDYRQVTQEHIRKTSVSDAERQQLSMLTQKAAKKQLTGADIIQNEELYRRARRVGFLSSDHPLNSQWYETARTDLATRLKTLPKDILGEPARSVDWERMNLPDQGPTARAVSKALALSEPGLALTVASEAMRLKAYKDPARGAGLNIGAGYNLDANKSFIADDFKDIGIPHEKWEGIKNGTDSVTEQQAWQLSLKAYRRAEGQTRKVVYELNPELWNRLGRNELAVLTDIAYQTGPRGLASFKKAFNALAMNDKDGFAREAQVTYIDNKTGQRVLDTNRNRLRASLFNSQGAFSELLKRKVGTIK